MLPEPLHTITPSNESLAGIDEINRRYDFHCRAAREIAEECFDSRKIMAHLIDEASNRRAPIEERSLAGGRP